MTRLPTIALAAALSLAACTPAAQQQIDTVLNTSVTGAQAFCGRASILGPAVVALIDASTGKAYEVTGRTAASVAAACAIVGGIPVVPPAVPAAVPAVAVKVPPVKV